VGITINDFSDNFLATFVNDFVITSFNYGVIDDKAATEVIIEEMKLRESVDEIIPTIIS
jgi:hypothetical protein